MGRLTLAAQYCPTASWDVESSLEHEKGGLAVFNMMLSNDSFPCLCRC